jgi:hypothetical protein
MTEKELFQQNLQAQLDAWQAAVDAWKASLGAQASLNAQLQELQKRIEEGSAKLAQLCAADNDVWEPVKGGVEVAWESMKSGFNETAAQFNRCRAPASVA